MSDGPNKTSANINSAIGTGKEYLGSALGNKDLEATGKQERASADAEYKAAQAKGYVDGTMDQVTGYKDHVLGAVTGSKDQELAGRVREEVGKAQKDANRPT